MEFRILGPLEVAEDGRVLDLTGQKQRALLAVLLLHANQVVSSDRLIEALWEGGPPETAAKALQVYVSQLRKQIGKERLRTKAPGYVVHVEPHELDLARFQSLRAEGRPREALELWRGPPLDEFAHQRFAQAEIARLEDLMLACREERIDADLDAGRHADVVGELEALVAEHPLRERLRGQLMLALYRSGRQADALETYTAARRALVDGIGIEPSRELRELHQAILNQDPALDLVVPRTDEHRSARGVLVGREAEFGELIAGLDDAFAGRGRLFLLVGEPGIGKSRLTEELIVRARGRGAQVLVGRCWEAGGAPAYWPWVQSFSAYVREAEPETLRGQLGGGAADLAQLVPELRELFPDLGEPSSPESDSARFRLFEATTSFLAAASRARPIVLVFDDLHAADEPSLLLLRFLAREISDSRLLLIGAYRDVDPTPSHPLNAAVTELGREPVTRTVALHGLDEDHVERFIELVSGETPSGELTATIYEETEGNPLFVGEIVRLLAEEGGLATGAPLRLTIPQSVRDVIARRLGHLSGECNRVLLLASVLGREFGLDALGRLAAVSVEGLLDTLDEAMEARVVSDLPGSPARLRFAHVLIRDTLYEGLTTARRVRLHRLVVEALETGPAADVAELAHHAIAGSDFDKGLLYARQAGDRALELLAYEEATRLYTMALDALALAAPDERKRCELLLALGEAQVRAGNSPVAKQTFLDAAEISRRLGLSVELGRAAAGYGGRIVWARAGSDDRLVPLLDEGLDALPEESVELRARLLARLAGALRDEHSRERRTRLSAQAVELARSTRNPAALAFALDGRGYAILGPDTVSEILTTGTELCGVAQAVGDRERVIAGHMLRVIALLLGCDLRGAEVEHATASRLADELGQPAQLWQAWGDATMLALATGRLAEAEDGIERALEFGQRALPDAAVPVYWLQRAALSEFRGHALADLEPAISEVVVTHPARPVFRCALAHLQARLGRTDEAREHLRDLSADDLSALPFDQEWPLGASFLAETSLLVGDVDSAAVLYPLLLPWAELNAVDVAEGFRGSMSRYLGQLAALLGRMDEAAAHFEDALAANERMGVRPWLAYTQNDYARLLSERDAPGDRERADELLAEARSTYRELGMREPD